MNNCINPVVDAFMVACEALWVEGRFCSILLSIQWLGFCFFLSVKDGEFRQYRGQRTEVDIVNFVKDELWKELDPVPWYLSPTSVQ